MSMTCTVCRHPERAAIDQALVAGEAPFALARRYSSLSEPALRRHKDAHLPAALVKAAGEEATRQALDVLQQLKAINNAALHVLKDARDAGDGELVLKAIDRVYRQIELQAKLLGDLDDRPVVNLLIAPEWLALRARIVGALVPFPEARAALAEVLGAHAG
jgi:hypothetical protein